MVHFLMANHWYYRERGSTELVGPMSYSHARSGARWISLDPDTSGQADLVVIRGDREGDSQRVTRRLFVVLMYVRGVAKSGGSAADQYIGEYSDAETLD